MFAFAQSTATRAILGLVGTTIGAALCLGAAAGPASAQTGQSFDAPRSAKVAIGDLNLGNADDHKRLDTRLRAAARSVCATGGDTVAARTQESQCIRATLKAAEPARMAAILVPTG